jgi:serine/threonine protein kinase
VAAIDGLYDPKLGQHQNLVKVKKYGNDTTHGPFFIDMELCDFNLDEYISNRPSTAESKNLRDLSGCSLTNGEWNTWDVMEQISGGIEFIHKCELIHRDLKPSNGISSLRH